MEAEQLTSAAARRLNSTRSARRFYPLAGEVCAYI
jgi:hypothetical protein